jgi:molybdopterin-binding protein
VSPRRHLDAERRADLGLLGGGAMAAGNQRVLDVILLERLPDRKRAFAARPLALTLRLRPSVILSPSLPWRFLVCSDTLCFLRYRVVLPTSNVPSTKEKPMKLSARNQLKGKIVDVIKGATTSHVKVDIGQGIIVTSAITNEAVIDLGLKKGDDAWAIIKASDVMIGK